MRTFSIIATALLLAYSSAFADKDRGAAPRTLLLTFSTGEKISFELTNTRVLAITLTIGQSSYLVPQSVCSRLREIRFDTVRLGWNGSYKSAAESDYFYIDFNMGPPRLGSYPDVPPVTLAFRNGKFEGAGGIDIP